MSHSSVTGVTVVTPDSGVDTEPWQRQQSFTFFEVRPIIFSLVAETRALKPEYRFSGRSATCFVTREVKVGSIVYVDQIE